MDMISNLPETILHKIMSMLPEKDAAGTCVLSKSWNHTHSTFPILDLKEPRYVRYYDKYNKNMEHFTAIRKQFFNVVDKTLLRFSNQGLSIKQLKLSMSLHDEDLKSGSPRIEYWMELAKERDVEVLDLKVYGTMYRIPSSFAQAKSLVTLRLEGDISLDQEFLSNPMEFSSLKVLFLARVHFVDKLVFQNILTSCPFIEDITLFGCHGIGFVCIQGLSKLKEVKISDYVMEIEIDAPSLESFQLKHYIRNCNKIKMDKCTNLNELSLIGFNITHQWFLKHYHLFNSLLTLELKYCNMPQRINISFPQLKDITLENCNGLKNAYIDAPKLYLCSYLYSGFGYKLPMISFSNCSSQLEFSVKLDISCGAGALDYGKLKEFFLELPCINVSASLSIFHIQEAENVVQDFSIHPPVLKHLHLCVPWEKDVSFSLVTGLLWSCHPSVISCRLSNRKLIKVLCEAIMYGKECFCSSRQIKCWWHDLKDVKITCSSGTDGNENGVDCKTFLDAMPTFMEGDACFKLE